MSFTTIQTKPVVFSKGRSRVYLPLILTDFGWYRPLIDFLKSSPTKEFPTLLNWVKGIALLMDFIEVHSKEQYEKPEKLFEEFTFYLQTGTVQKDCFDQYKGLWWKSMSFDSAHVRIHGINLFLDHLYRNHGTVHLNPLRKANSYEERMLATANYNRYDNDSKGNLLKHLKQTRGRVDEVRAHYISRKRKVVSHDPKKVISSKDWEALFFKGIEQDKYGKQRHPAASLRDRLILLLLHYGGLRISEALALWFTPDDVHIETNDKSKNYEGAIVRIYKEDVGAAPFGWKNPTGGENNREEYQKHKFNILPRCKLAGAQRNGSKSCVVENDRTNYFTVDWFPPEAAKTFMFYWNQYSQFRLAIREKCNHPFAFIAFQKGYDGNPYKYQAFQKNVSRAFERVGVTPSWLNGTTSHGHRTSYCQSLSRGGFNTNDIQNSMHHSSPESQQPYLKGLNEEHNDLFHNASKELLEKDKVSKMPIDWNDDNYHKSRSKYNRKIRK